MSKKKILVVAPALSASGYGVQSRYALKALRAHEDKFDIYLHNTQWGNTGWVGEETEEREWIDFLIGKTHVYASQGGQFDVSLQITIPNEFKRMAPVNIGYTAGIETTKIAPQWIEKSNEMNSLIVISNHSKYGFDNTEYTLTNKQTGEVIQFKNTTPVHVVNYCCRDIKPSKLSLKLKTDFNFLSVAQWGPRKNVEDTISGFIKEFKDEENVGLVLKVNLAKNSIIDREHCANRIKAYLSNFEDRKCKIYLLHGELDDSEMQALYQHPKIKAFVTTTHGEGFGLPIFEAAIAGLPIISPNWSGQIDFLYAPVKDKKSGKVKNKAHFMKVDYDMKPVQREAVWEGVIQPDSMWCFVKEGSLRIALREVYKNHDQKLSVAKKLSEYLKKEFTQERFNKEFLDAMGLSFEEEEDLQGWLDELNNSVVEHA